MMSRGGGDKHVSDATYPTCMYIRSIPRYFVKPLKRLKISILSATQPPRDRDDNALLSSPHEDNFLFSPTNV